MFGSGILATSWRRHVHPPIGHQLPVVQEAQMFLESVLSFSPVSSTHSCNPSINWETLTITQMTQRPSSWTNTISSLLVPVQQAL
jgi:hypothetical protein